ncbi:3-isopropylmalate dehydratase small subunit [Oribacterium sinus]|uniref:3-isopropylmalate dehydratase small subunit n=1 Tax=Oribacterium sinus TaxID=237576 RepID=UPI0028E51A89|nr:3-isopropylmalate dehydratase small subunit [Oribacterium sinus]
MEKAKGHCVKYGDNVDTDVIIPARYLAIQDKAELATHAMEDIDLHFHEKIKKGDLLIVGKNFGCGSSREHAPQVLKDSGISCVIAESFARIFFRNALNIGLAIVEAPEAAKEIQEGEELEVDFTEGKIHNLSSGKSYTMAVFPPFLQEMIDKGGLIASVNEKLEKMQQKT